MGDSDHPYSVAVAVALSSAADLEWPDSSDAAPGLETDFDRSHPYALACIARRDDEDRDRRVESQRTPDMDWCGRFCDVPRPSPNDVTHAMPSTYVAPDLTRAPDVWQPRHGGGAHLVVGGVVVVEIEPMGSGWWVGAGVGDLVNGTLGEAKVRALELLEGST